MGAISLGAFQIMNIISFNVALITGGGESVDDTMRLMVAIVIASRHPRTQSEHDCFYPMKTYSIF